jgi:hypothetical protein
VIALPVDGIKFLPGWQTAYVRIPIACTLSSEAATDRVGEWRHFLAHATDAVERVNDQRLRMRLKASAKILTDAVDLARREKVCCPFFKFSIEIEEESSWLTIEVPPDATKVLADFESLLSRQQ